MVVHEFLEKNAKRFPEKDGLIFASQRYTYREIDEKSNQLAHALLDAGLKRGDRVSIFMDNAPGVVFAIYGTLKAGGIFTTLSPTLKARKLKYILDNSGASFLISHHRKYPVVSGAIKD
ncbi:MAG: long-chain fatty acid--CoA ligase, partial [bacterium]|nr:long-chain fatty acid--CoA ligase [bacterium]